MSQGMRRALVLALAAGAVAVRGCPPGEGGKGCEFKMSTIFFEHNVYEHMVGTNLPRALDLQGWSPGHEVYDELVARSNASLIVEVGVWKGVSASYLAGNLKRAGGGVLFAVDTWLGALEFWNRRISGGAQDSSRDLQWSHGYPTVYRTFLSNIVHQELQDYVVPFPVPSRLAAEFFAEKGMQADLIHVDAAHEYDDVLEDLRWWWPLVRPCGILFGDDYPGWEGVKRAVDEWAAANDLQLEVRDPKWIVRKPCEART